VKAGEEQGHLNALHIAHNRRFRGLGIVKNDSDVVRPLLKRWQCTKRDWVRDACSPLIECDDATEAAEPTEISFDARLLPHQINVPKPWRDEQ
jgi:hypothetical protein